MDESSEKKNIYPCLTWIRAGCAKQRPDKIALDKDELKKIIEETHEKLAEKELLSEDEEKENEDEEHPESEESEKDNLASAVEKAQNIAKNQFRKTLKSGSKRKQDEEDEDDIVAKYGLDDYDDDDFGHDHLHGIGSLAHFASNDDDPYITLKEEGDSDEEDFILQPTDNLLTMGRVTADAAVLEVHVYNGDMSSMFIHHDYVLPTLPLVLEWMDYDVADGDKGNFVAMGTMEPDISIWDLDVVDCLEPVTILKGVKQKKSKKKMKKKETISGGHSDAVLDLSWNRNVRNVLASASADTTVCLWDLSSGQVVTSLKHHEQQVQCASWHPVESQLLLTGSFDQNAAVVDCRSPEDSLKKWELKGEVERLIWNNFSPFQFLASTDSGMLYCVDTRQDKPLYSLSAHDEAVTGLCLSSQIAGLLVTTSSDKIMKVWDILEDKPSLVLNRHLHLDVLHCVECNPDHPFVFAFGGNKDYKVWDIRESAAVRNHFLGRMPAPLAEECQDDDKDLPAESLAMANLKMEDAEGENEEQEMEEMLAGDTGKTTKKKSKAAGSSESDTTGKKKKQKRKKKKKEVADD